MSRKNSVATRKRYKIISSSVRQETPEKLTDQHQHQTSSQTQASPATNVVSSQTPNIEPLLSEIK